MPEVTEQYIRVPVARGMTGDAIRTIVISADKGIKALVAKLSKGGTRVITYLFSRSSGWTMPKAKQWVADHKSSDPHRVYLYELNGYTEEGAPDGCISLSVSGLYDGAGAATPEELGDTDAEYGDDAEYKTETVEGIEIAELGRHVDKDGKVWTATMEQFRTLVADWPRLKELGWRAAVRVGEHTDHGASKLLGLMSAGYFDNLRIAGKKLVADAVSVPSLLAKAMRAGAFARISPGIKFGVRVGQELFSLALDHGAVLGWKAPAMKGLAPIDQLARMYQNEAGPGQALSYECDTSFEGLELVPDDGAEEGGALGKTVNLSELGFENEADLRAKLDAAEAAEKRAAAAEKDQKAAEVALEEERTRVRKAAATAFMEQHKKRVKPVDRPKFEATHAYLAGTEVFEFSAGEGTKVEVTPLAVFEQAVSSMAEVVNINEDGPNDEGDPRDGEPDDDDGTPPTDGTLTVHHSEMPEKVIARARELVKEASEAGDTLHFGDAVAQATVELAGDDL